MAIFGARTTSGLFSSSTYCVVIGVSEYVDGRLRRLPAAAPETEELKRALLAPDGIAIPEANVTALVGPDACYQNLVSALEGAARRVSVQDRLFVYFAGHGIALADGFGLCANDSRIDDPASLITSDWLQQIFAACAAQGLLFVLDCCGGAALAERAPALFSAAGNADYRILLSASRRHQSSWETPEGSLFTRFLLKALRGEEAIGSTPGRLYFNDLNIYLHDRVLEERETRYPELSPQEPLATGSFLRDPLLFVHGRLTLSQVVVQTQRYSRAYVRRVMFRGFALFAAISSFAIGGYWTFLDELQHAVLTDGGVLVRHGHPTLQGFGLPRDLWEYRLSRDDVAEKSQLARGRALVAPLGEEVAPLIPTQLTETGRAHWWYMTGDHERALGLLRNLVQHSAGLTPAERLRAIQLFGAFAQPKDLPQLLALIPQTPSDYQRDVAREALRVGQATAVHALITSAGPGLGPSLIHDTLSELFTRCTAELQTDLDTFANEKADHNDLPLLFYSASMTGCRLPWSYLERVAFGHENLVAAHLRTSANDQFPALVESLTVQLETQIAPNPDAQATSGKLVELMTLLPPGRCPKLASLETFEPRWRVLDSVAVILARSCPEWSLEIADAPAVDGKPAYTLRLNGANGAAKEVRRYVIGRENGNWLSLLEVLERMPIHGDEALLQKLVAAPDDIVSRYSMIELHRRRIRPSQEVKTYFGTTYQQLATVALVYWADRDRAGALREVFARLPDPAADYVAQALALLKPRAEERAMLFNAVSSGRVANKRRARLLAMFGSPETVVSLLCSAQADSRDAARDGLPFRDDLDVVGAVFRRTSCAVPDVTDALARILREKVDLTQMLDSGPTDLRNLRQSIAVLYVPDRSDGLRYWLERDCLECI